MNFKQLDRFIKESSYDEIKVIGKDVEMDERFIHLIGMTRKDKQAFVYALESVNSHDEEVFTEQTHRKQLKDSYECERENIFWGIKEFHSNGKVYEVAGVDSCITESYNMAEHLLFYLTMRENGWKMSAKSPLYKTDWDCLKMSVMELSDELEELPDWGTDLEIVRENHAMTEVLEIPVTLTCGETPTIPFRLADGTQAECYINKICLKDVWADHERRFNDKDYIARVLQHVSREEFQKMKEQCEEALLAECPRGKCYMLVEYECNADVAVNFYATSHLDAEPQVCSGSATSIIIMHRPEAEEGTHGFKLRGCILQTPIEHTAASLEAELFSYTETGKECTEKLY